MIQYGSSNSGPKIASGIAGLQNTTLQSFSIIGRVPELEVRFSNSQRLRSMSMRGGNPQWSIRMRDGRRIHSRGESLLVGEGASETTRKRRPSSPWPNAPLRVGAFPHSNPRAVLVNAALHSCVSTARAPSRLWRLRCGHESIRRPGRKPRSRLPFVFVRVNNGSN